MPPRFRRVFTIAALFSFPISHSLAQPATGVNWQPIPLVSPESLKMPGVTIGGEGGQWPRAAPAISPADPNFLLLPIDVGGLYRSLDGGKLWRQSSAGWNARGANAFAFDPKNAARVLGVGGNGDNWNPTWGQSPNGLYISTDKAASWKQTLAVPDGKAGRILIDPSSFDRAKGFCTRAYYSAPLRGLFRSDDGGLTWTGINRIAATESDAPTGVALIAVHPTNGTLYLAGKNGFYRSTDKGKTFVKTENGERTANIAGLSVATSQPDKVWISNLAGLSVSLDGGKTFQALPAKGITRDADSPLREVTVSPTDTKRMLVWVQNANYNWVRYLSVDGGQNFKPVLLQAGLQKRGALESPDGIVTSNALIAGGPAFLPFNTRQGFFSWHPTDAKIAYGIGGDWVTKSTDGGKTFNWSNNGNNGVMIGSSFNFDAAHPDTVFLATQDNNGSFSTDGGKTWNYRDVSGRGWGGFVYGAGQLGTEVMWGGDAESWGAPRNLRLSRDGGATWKSALGADGKNIVWSGADVSYTDPKTSNLFASNWRSTDKGATWNAMNAGANSSGCEGVYAHAGDGRLFGKSGDSLVQSKDGGATWDSVVDVEGGWRDVAFDSKRERWYFASQSQLKSWDKNGWKSLAIPKDQKGNTKCISVAVDPLQTDVVYGGGAADIYKSSATVYRSRDAGQTWENLSRGDGPQEVQWIRVNPKTGDAWVSGECFGMWRIARPATLGAADPKLGSSALSEVVPDGETPAPEIVGGAVKMAKEIRDFNGQGLDYTYGPVWKNGDNVKVVDGALRLDTTEWGGGGAVLNGANLSPFGETHLAIRARLLPGNAAKTLSANIVREGKDGVTLSFDLSKLADDKWTILAMPLGAGDFSKVAQLQLQGGNFGAGAAALRIDIDSLGLVKLPPGTSAWSQEDGAALPVKMAPVVATLPTVADPNITRVIRDFGPGGADYTFGPAWKNGENVKPVEGALRIDTTQAGGAGLVLNGADIAAQGQTLLAMRARVLPGNAAQTLSVNIMRSDDKGGKATLSFDLSGLKTGEWTTLTQPLGPGQFDRVDQLQVQGTNWSPDSPALKIEIDTLGTTSSDAAANARAREATANDPSISPAPKGKPAVAGWGFYPDFPGAWMAMHRGFVERTKQGREGKKIDIVFLGDSITQGWGGAGKAVWEKRYAPLNAVNYGIGGDSTRQVLWRLQNGEVDGLNPKLVVLKIGTNNLYGDGNAGSDEEIVAGIATIVSTLQTKLPRTKILLLGLLPRQNDFFSGRIKNINALASKLDNGTTIRFLDMGTHFQAHEGQGDVFPELYNDDHLHLAAKGYEVWADTMAPLFEQMRK